MCSSRKNPYPPHGRPVEFPRGRGVLKAKILEAKYEAKLEFLWGWSMDIFWNYTIMICPSRFVPIHKNIAGNLHRK